MRRAAVLAAVFLVASIGTAAPAGAHAEIRTSDPTAGGVAPTGLDQVSLTFITADTSQPIEVSVLDPDGNEMVDGDVRIKDSSASGTTVIVPVKPLQDGIHYVSWKATSSDTHGISTGTFEFTVQPASDSGSVGVWLLWIVALAIPAVIFLRPGARRKSKR